MSDKIELNGAELIAIAGSLSIAIGRKFEKEDLRKLRFFFSSVASNLAIIEAEGCGRLYFDDRESKKKDDKIK